MKVIYRQFPEGDAIALFPDTIWDSNGNIASYQKVGQHGGASPDLVNVLEPATAQQVTELSAELMRAGYRLKHDVQIFEE